MNSNKLAAFGRFLVNKGKSLFAAAAVATAALVSTPKAQAAITWDFTDATDELAGLGTAIVTAGGVAIAGGLVVYGLWKGVGFVLKIFSRVSSK